MTTTPLTEAKPRRRSYPPPLARCSEHPLRWTRNTVQNLVTSIPASHLAILAWIAVYFICFELVHPVKEFWDTMLSRHVRLLSQSHWNTWRHFFRGGGEAYLATITVLFFLFNPYKHKTESISLKQVPGRVLIALALVIPLFVGLGLLVHGLQHWFSTGTLAPTISSHPSLAAKLYADSWTTKVVVVISGFIARRPMFPVFKYVLDYFAERRVARGKHDRWWQPPAYRATQRLVDAEGDVATRQARRWHGEVLVVRAGVFLTLALAAYGAYILNHYAK